MKNINNTKKKAKTLKAKSSLLEFRKDFREPKEREIKQKQNRRVIFKPISASVDHMDKLKEKAMMKRRLFRKKNFERVV